MGLETESGDNNTMFSQILREAFDSQELATAKNSDEAVTTVDLDKKPKNINEIASWLFKEDKDDDKEENLEGREGGNTSMGGSKALQEKVNKVLSNPQDYRVNDWNTFKAVAKYLVAEGRDLRALNLLKDAKCSNAEALIKAFKKNLPK